MKKQLAKLTKIELRDVWPHEALDFTKWLALEENLDALSEEVGIDIKLIDTEVSVGKFSVDILAEEENTGHKVIIENQLEDTDHDHLGKIITYASGHDAKVIIWVVRDAREEHRQAIEWLNSHTDDEIGFFLIKIELYQIDDSSPAPKFEIISKPNEWAKTIRTNSTGNDLSNTKLQQLEFWESFKSYVRTKNTSIRLQTTRPQHWYDVSMGSSEAHVALTVNTREDLVGCEVYINKNKDLYSFLVSNKDEIEKELGEPAIWVDAAKASRIKVSRKVNGVFNEKELESYFAWLYEKTVLFQTVFSKYFKEFKNNQPL
jgi:hypothetical protein